MIPRIAESRIRTLSRQFPVIVVSGPRQSGKTTLAKALFPDRSYLNLERPDTLERLRSDPLGTLSSLKGDGAVIDEAQRFPELASWLQAIVDEAPKPGTWILTGSNQPLLRQSVSQSLAGRAAYAMLHPFCLREVRDHERIAKASTDEIIFSGWYPPLFDRPFRTTDWYEQYVATYLERDLSRLIRVKDLSLFQRFLTLCAGRTAQVLNVSDLARDVGTSHPTIREWLSVLEHSFLIHFLQPYHENFQKRVVKSPKLYFLDTGLAAWLMRIREKEQLSAHPLRGALFETLVVAERLKDNAARGAGNQLYFWNSPSHGEIDLVDVNGVVVSGTEIKSSATFQSTSVEGLLRWGRLADLPEGRLELIYDGEDSFEFRKVLVRPWRRMS